MITAIKNPKTSKGRKTKAQIVEKSIELIKRKGFSNVTLQDLCKTSGVANGTFYHYFASTTDILRELILKEIDDMGRYYETLSIESYAEKAMLLLEYVIDYFERKGRDIVATIYLNALKQGKGIVDPYNEFTENLLIDLIREGQEMGEFSNDFEPEFYAANILSLVFYQSSKWILEETGSSLADLTLGHLRKEISRMLV